MPSMNPMSLAAFAWNMLARDILDPEKCQNIVSGVAACPTALQLEAIGDEAIPFLKDALESDSFDVRFQAAQSLAYLGNAWSFDPA
jgi:HEAT repeat protein